MTADRPDPMELLGKLEQQINEMILESTIEQVLICPGLANLLEHLPALRVAIEMIHRQVGEFAERAEQDRINAKKVGFHAGWDYGVNADKRETSDDSWEDWQHKMKKASTYTEKGG